MTKIGSGSLYVDQQVFLYVLCVCNPGVLFED